MTPDMVNGLFELVGSFVIWRSICLLYHQKKVCGVSTWTTGFFMVWGFWNTWYYPHLNQWFSFIGGCSIVLANTIWVVQMLYYIYFYKSGENKCLV
jgi:hypothetical protein